MDTWEQLAEVARLMRRQEATLDRMSEQLERLEKLVQCEQQTSWELAEGISFTVEDDDSPRATNTVKGGAA